MQEYGPLARLLQSLRLVRSIPTGGKGSHNLFDISKKYKQPIFASKSLEYPIF